MAKRNHRGKKSGVQGGAILKAAPVKGVSLTPGGMEIDAKMLARVKETHRCPACNGPVAIREEEGKKPQIKVSGAHLWENLKPEDPAVLEHLKKRREGKKTLCILGTSPDNCNLAPWGEGLDMWGVNDGHRLSYIEPHWNEITGWFQIHHRWRWTLNKEIEGSERLRYGQQHYEFLTAADLKFPIWMQREYEDVPRSVEYPFEEVVGQLTYKLLERGPSYLKKYFTSSFSYMMGLALADIPGFPGPYDRIELYGVQLAQQIEYMQQRPSTEFWIGLAVGRGVEVYVPGNSYVLSGETYGYRQPHGNPMIGQIDEDNVGYWDWDDGVPDWGIRDKISWG
jgi:hypothetical protein